MLIFTTEQRKRCWKCMSMKKYGFEIPGLFSSEKFKNFLSWLKNFNFKALSFPTSMWKWMNLDISIKLIYHSLYFFRLP